MEIVRSLNSMLTCIIFATAVQSHAASPTEDERHSAATTDYIYEQRVEIKTLDERDLVYFLDRPKIDELGENQKVPLLIVVDGSGCVGQLRPGMRSLYRPSTDRLVQYARLIVEKPGVRPEASESTGCSEEFMKYYSIDQRVTDHLRVLQHLKKTGASWWNGEVLIWGWSDGGDIAVQLTAYYPNVTRSVLGAMGGGHTMAEHFEDFWICPKNRVGEERAKCLADLRTQFQQIFDNPTWTKTWAGQDNSWKVWRTRLFARHAEVLKDNTVPILIVHGEKDYDSTPVSSARRLVELLNDSGNKAYTYWEIPEMGHGASSLPAAQSAALELAMLYWVLGVNAGSGGPPHFEEQLTKPWDQTLS